MTLTSLSVDTDVSVIYVYGMPARRHMPPAPEIPVKGRRMAKDDRRTKILDVARHIFSTQGYAASNVQDICQAAGIARGTFYLYFDSKPAILAALLGLVEERVRKVMIQRLTPDRGLGTMRKTDLANVVRFCEARLGELLAAVFVDEPSLRVMVREARGAGGVIEEHIARIDDIILAALERDLRVALDAKLLRPVNPRIAARFILGGIEKVLLLALAKDEPLNIPGIIRETVQLELFGLLSDEVRTWR